MYYYFQFNCSILDYSKIISVLRLLRNVKIRMHPVAQTFLSGKQIPYRQSQVFKFSGEQIQIEFADKGLRGRNKLRLKYAYKQGFR